MKVVVGSPGTVSGLLLRSGQCLFAAASIAFMVSASGFSSYTAFCYLVASMGLQALWSLGLGFLDVYALKMKRDLHNPVLVSLFVVGDWAIHEWNIYLISYFCMVELNLLDLWPNVASRYKLKVTATLSLAAACSSGGVSVLFSRDVGFCSAYPQLSCKKFEISVVLAFTTWLFIAMSSLVMFWLLASV